MRHRLLLPVTLTFFVGLFVLSWLRHLHFGSHAYDLGAYENLFYNLGRTGVPWNAVERGHQWGNHFEIGLLWLWLPFRFAPSPAWLLLLQAACVSASALPIEAMARRAMGDARRSLAVTIAVWITPQLVLAHLYDFHAMTLCALPIAVLVLAIEWDRPGWVFAAAIVCLSLREPLGLAVAAAGPAWIVRHGIGRVRHAALLSLVGLAWFVVLIAIVIPHFAGGGTFRYASAYGRLGGSPKAALWFILHRPWALFRLAFEEGRGLYLVQLCGGALPFVILSLRWVRSAYPLLIAAPLLLIQLLNDRWEISNIHFHYGSVVVPLIAAAAVLAIARFGQARAQDAAVATWLVANLVWGLGWSLGPRLWSKTGALSFDRHDDRWSALALVPKMVTVSAQQDLLPHLADRPTIHAWPDGEREDQVIVLDATGMEVNKALRTEIAAAIARLRNDPRFVVRFDRGGAFVAERRAP